MGLTVVIILAGAALYFAWRHSAMRWRRVVANAGAALALLWGLFVLIWIVTHWGSTV